MTRGGILSSDITRCACRRKSECSACNSSAINSTKLAAGTEKVRWKCCADPCLSGAIWGLSLKLPTRGGHVCMCLVLIWWVLCWLGDLTWAHRVCIVPCQQGHPFPSPPPSSRSRIVASLQSWPWCFPLPPCSGKLPGWPEKVIKTVSCAASCQLSSLKLAGSLFSSFPCCSPHVLPWSAG